jgi:hypothetical protein
VRRFGMDWNEAVAAQKYVVLMEAELCGSASPLHRTALAG